MLVGEFSPGISSSAGKTKGNGSTGHGNRYLARILGKAAVGAGKTDSFLGNVTAPSPDAATFRAPPSPRRPILVIVWHLLADRGHPFHPDLGADHFTKHVNPDANKRNHIRQLEALGYTVTLTPAA